VDYIEGGYPLSNPKDFEYFQAVRDLPLAHSKVCAFGMTRKKNTAPESDTCLKAILDAKTPVVTIVGKTWDFHVTNVLGTTLEENLRMIADSVAYCKSQGREVFYDAEHFFDGYWGNPEYALQTLQAAANAGAKISVRVSGAPARAHKVSAGAPLFVAARDPKQPGPPFAVKRLAASFPVDVELTAADAMLDSRRITAGQQLEVVARVALGGTPTASSGDPFGQVSYHVGKDGRLNIVIDRVSP
jgi:hypothetical protein